MSRTVLAVSAVWLTLGSAGCDKPEPTAVPEPVPAESSDDATPLEPETASNREAGEVVELTFARADGSSWALAELRGQPVLVVVDAPWSEDWARGLELFAALKNEDGLQVVVVVADQDASQVDAVEALGLRGAWDPQGAIAAQLSAATFPTLLVLDAEGRMVWQAKQLDEPGLRQALGEASSGG